MQNLKVIFNDNNQVVNVLPGNIALRTLESTERINSMAVALPTFPNVEMLTPPPYTLDGLSTLATMLSGTNTGVFVNCSDDGENYQWNGDNFARVNTTEVIYSLTLGYNDWVDMSSNIFTLTAANVDKGEYINITPFLPGWDNEVSTRYKNAVNSGKRVRVCVNVYYSVKAISNAQILYFNIWLNPLPYRQNGDDYFEAVYGVGKVNTIINATQIAPNTTYYGAFLSNLKFQRDGDIYNLLDGVSVFTYERGSNTTPVGTGGSYSEQGDTVGPLNADSDGNIYLYVSFRNCHSTSFFLIENVRVTVE